MSAFRIDRLCRSRGSLIDGDGRSVLSRCYVADRPLARLVGLLGTVDLDHGEGVLLVPCRSIHTFGMRMVIDCVVVDRDGLVLQVVEHLGPARTLRVRAGHAVLEARAGELSAVSVGDRLAVIGDGERAVARQIFPH